MRSENSKKVRLEGNSDFSSEDWYLRAREQLSILNHNRRRALLLASAKRSMWISLRDTQMRADPF